MGRLQTPAEQTLEQVVTRGPVARGGPVVHVQTKGSTRPSVRVVGTVSTRRVDLFVDHLGAPRVVLHVGPLRTSILPTPGPLPSHPPIG